MRPAPELPCPTVTRTDNSRQHGIEPLLSVEEVSQVLHISERGIYRFVSSGALPRVKVGQRTLFDPADVRRFIESRRDEKVPATARSPIGSEQPASGPTQILQVPGA